MRLLPGKGLSIKQVEFRGSSLDDLKAFPKPALQEMGHQIFLVQSGEQPTHAKPMGTIGRGVSEIIVTDDGNAYRTIYVARFADVVFVLHCFQKKTAKTAALDLAIATQRYKALVKELSNAR